MALKPDILKGEMIYSVDPKTNERRPIDREELEKIAREHAPLSRFFADLSSGTVSLSLQEYVRMPATIMDAWATWNLVRAETQEDEVKRIKRGNTR